MKAWLIVGRRMRFSLPVPQSGEIIYYEDPVTPHVPPLQASRRIIDALSHATGNTICRVECGGRVADYNNSLICCTEQKILWRVDGEQLLRQFARQCALDVANLWDMTNVVRRYLETGYVLIADKARVASVMANGSCHSATSAIISSCKACDLCLPAFRAADTASYFAEKAIPESSISKTQNRRLTSMVMAEYRRGRNEN